jgi:hypothetical protein
MKTFIILGIACGFINGSLARAEDSAPKDSGEKKVAKEVKQVKEVKEETTTTKVVEEKSEVTGSDFGGYGKPHGLLGPVTLGPQITLLGLPTLFRFGLEGKFANILGFGAEYGFIPNISLSGVTLGLNSFQATAKVFPFRGAFHLGLAVGSQNFAASIPTTVGGNTFILNASANTIFMTPVIGWKWVDSNGFFYGLDLGWQFALSSSPSITSSNPALLASAVGDSEYTSLNNLLSNIGKASLPLLTLVQLGWLF